MQEINQQYLKGERALFKAENIKIKDSVFYDGESPLKESRNVEIEGSTFRWKYPIWYSTNVKADNITLVDTARSGIWYTNNIQITNSIIEAPKTFRRTNQVTLKNVNLSNAEETFWNCKDVVLNTVSVRGDYFGFDSQNIIANRLHLVGNYAFDGCKNVEVRGSKLIAKDAFWNCEDVVVYDSTIIGEYLGWNSKNITFINCTIESLQGLCYIENLKLINCKLINTTQAFEYSTVDATVVSHIDSIMNPISGVIKAKSIGEIILDESKINPNNTEIITDSTIADGLSTCHIFQCCCQ